MPRTDWRGFSRAVGFMERLLPLPERRERDPLEEEAKLLRVEKLRRDVRGPSPEMKERRRREEWLEEQRSQQVGSVLRMLSEQWRESTAAQRKILGEQALSMWEMMSPAERTKFNMIVSKTPINPRVQKAMWFEEANPRPKAPIVQLENGTFTNTPPRTKEWRKYWAEFEIAKDEWGTLRKMAMEDSKEGKADIAKWKKVPKQYPTDDPNVTAYRDPIDRQVKFFNWGNADQAEVANAVEMKWATMADMQKNGEIPLGPRSDYKTGTQNVSAQQVRDVVSGKSGVRYYPTGPADTSGVKPPEDMTDAVLLIDTDKDPSDLDIKKPGVVSLHAMMRDIVDSRGMEREDKARQLRHRIAETRSPKERFVPFFPEEAREKDFWYRVQWFADWVPGLAWFVPTPKPGMKGNVILARVDEFVSFYDVSGEGMGFWRDNTTGIVYGEDGLPIEGLSKLGSGEQIQETWAEFERKLNRQRGAR